MEPESRKICDFCGDVTHKPHEFACRNAGVILYTGAIFLVIIVMLLIVIPYGSIV